MEHEQVTTFAVEAQESCVLKDTIHFEGIGTRLQQPNFKPIKRRILMAAVNTVAKELGLRASSVMVIDALLSCLPCKDSETGADKPITPLTLLTVFASNSTLCFRAKGITDRQLRRHLARLEEIGLIQRKDSANGKRFPIYRAGKVVGAFGIDLSPLLEMASDLCRLAERQREEAEELRGLRSCVQKLRNKIQDLSPDTSTIMFLENAQKIMRRTTTTLDEAYAILAKLRSILNSNKAEGLGPRLEEPERSGMAKTCGFDHKEKSQTRHMTATDGQSVRHKETINSYTKKRNPRSLRELWESMKSIPQFYPDPPRSDHQMLQIIFDLGKMLRIRTDTLKVALSRLGNVHTLLVQDQIANNAHRIERPEAYLSRIIQRSGRSVVGHGQLPNSAW